MRTLALVIAALALAGCALRPRYAEFVGKETTAPVKLQLLEKKSGIPVAGAQVEVGETRSRVVVKTDTEGFFMLPVDKKLMDDNALIVVTAPAGVGRTQVIAAPGAGAVGPEAVAVPPAPVVTGPADVVVVDAGTN